MTDIENMIEEAENALKNVYPRSDNIRSEIVRALQTIAPLDLLAGVKAGTHVVVPVEPTEGMLIAGRMAPDHAMMINSARQVYESMLAARPGANNG